MQMQKLTIETIPDMDAAIAIAFNQALQSIYHDCCDRPHLKKVREITLKVSVKPRADADSSILDAVELDISVGSKIPGKGTTRVCRAVPAMNGFGFLSHTDNVRGINPDQTHMEFFDEDEDGD